MKTFDVSLLSTFDINHKQIFFQSLYEETLDLWANDRKKWNNLVKNLREEINSKILRHVFIASWNTNYGEKVALIYAKDFTHARKLIEDSAWDNYELEPIILPTEYQVLFIKGGE
jgi:nicotinamide mononucleotide adenylyltransferase